MSRFTPHMEEDGDNNNVTQDDNIHLNTVGEIIFPSKFIAPTRSQRHILLAEGGEGDSLDSLDETQNLLPSPKLPVQLPTLSAHHQLYPSSASKSQNLLGHTTNGTFHQDEIIFQDEFKSIRTSSSGHASPFFRPSTPQPVTVTRTLSTPNGTHVLQQKKEKMVLLSKKRNKTDKLERKSNILGATSNLVNTIVGAGIIGIPYAMNQTGLLAGVLLIILVAILTDKSLRMLIETGKHADVQSYEMLMEAVFSGRLGFVFISINMFLMSFGAMVCYLLIIKQTFAHIVMGNEWIVDMLNDFGLAGSGLQDKNKVGEFFLILSSLAIILPLSMQRDMANLSTTSTLSVAFDILMVLIVAVSSPVEESIKSSGGLANVMKHSTIHVQTFFIGLGVLSFAFVCQDSSFIIAGSLHQPTKKRWSVVTRSSLTVCTMLAIVIGVTGYVGFQNNTVGNVLQNFSAIPKSETSFFGTIYTYQAINVARILLGLTMFCVYPLASYVARHVLIVLFFSGNTAHSGDDHSVLARWDRRFVLTFSLYGVALVLALLCDDLGKVLALTGAIAGSSLSYLGPGITYLGIHGLSFLDQFGEVFAVNDRFSKLLLNHPSNLKVPYVKELNYTTTREETGLMKSMLLMVAWYMLLMPIWCSIGFHGGRNFDEFKKVQAIRSGFAPSRLGKIIHKRNQEIKENDRIESGTLISNEISNYGTIDKDMISSTDEGGEKDFQDYEPPKLQDFFMAITYILFGIVALTAGIFSITSNKT